MQVALLAGTHSGCGKTTIMLTLLQYFQDAKQHITAFKSGPDFIDPLWHQAITGKPSYNLDTRMMRADACRLQLVTKTADTEIALIEGVMGLFDGAAGVGGEGSSIDLACALACPVILVVDASGMSGSIAAVVSGFVNLAIQKGGRISGIIANKVGSAYHAELLQNALSEYDLPPLIAWMERSNHSIDERHLGLKMPDRKDITDYLPFFHVDLTIFMKAFSEHKIPEPAISIPKLLLAGKTIGVAKDAACCFIYPANLDWLTANGAKVKFFSPLASEEILPEIDAIWLPGGYPELHTQQLSESSTWQSLKAFVESGKPVLAECGGAMLLGKSIIDSTGKIWPMANIFPYESHMHSRLAALGYRQEKSGVRGHEYHYSKRENDHGLEPAFCLEQGDNGVRYKNTRASYIHWYFSGAPEQVAAWFDG